MIKLRITSRRPCDRRHEGCAVEVLLQTASEVPLIGVGVVEVHSSAARCYVHCCLGGSLFHLLTDSNERVLVIKAHVDPIVN